MPEIGTKVFYKQINGELHPHRDNDLPAYVLNDTHTPEGNVCIFHYYTDDEHIRLNGLLAACIEFEDGKTIHSLS